MRKVFVILLAVFFSMTTLGNDQISLRNSIRYQKTLEEKYKQNASNPIIQSTFKSPVHTSIKNKLICDKSLTSSCTYKIFLAKLEMYMDVKLKWLSSFLPDMNTPRLSALKKIFNFSLAKKINSAPSVGNVKFQKLGSGSEAVFYYYLSAEQSSSLSSRSSK